MRAYVYMLLLVVCLMSLVYLCLPFVLILLSFLHCLSLLHGNFVESGADKQVKNQM